MRKFRSWTADEIERARPLYTNGGPNAVRAAMFPEMTRAAIQQRCMRLGMRRAGVVYREWTTLQVATLKQLWLAGTPRREIAARLGVKESAVQDKVLALKLPLRNIPWKPGQRRVVAQAADALIEHMAVRLGRSPGSVVAEVMKALVRYRKRRGANARRLDEVA